MHRTMSDVMKAMGGAKRGPMAGLANMLGFGGGGGRMPSPEEMAKLAEKMPGGLPPGMPGAPGLPPTMPGLPNFPERPTAELSRITGARPEISGRLSWFGKKEVILQSTLST